ncbi:MAG: 16S rRNA (uracil(1498)-N(3))-methyltransferase [Ruminococcaceae bacterium]|nr:16S rRNA (uracil(1498)-N(3))-methyltransferase [Oscillospiraceae bacterium]
MARFFVSSDHIEYDDAGCAKNVLIKGTDVRHIKDVLRMSVGDTVTLCDSCGNEYVCSISDICNDFITTSVISAARCGSEPRIAIVLCQGIAKGEKMDFIIQKNVELGLNEIIPVLTEHTVVKFANAKDAEKKQIRWQRISEEAAKQCGRGVVPIVGMPDSYKNVIDRITSDDDTSTTLYIMPYENETDRTLKTVLYENKDFLNEGGSIKRICVFIGPEGGFSKKETEYAVSKGFTTVTLGKRILRTETAGMATVAAIRYEIGD